MRRWRLSRQHCLGIPWQWHSVARRTPRMPGAGNGARVEVFAIKNALTSLNSDMQGQTGSGLQGRRNRWGRGAVPLYVGYSNHGGKSMTPTLFTSPPPPGIFGSPYGPDLLMLARLTPTPPRQKRTKKGDKLQTSTKLLVALTPHV